MTADGSTSSHLNKTALNISIINRIPPTLQQSNNIIIIGINELDELRTCMKDLQ